MNVVVSRNKGLALNELRENATNTPDVDAVGVLVAGEHDFGSSVPTCDYVFGEWLAAVVGTEATGETEVADLQVTVGVDQQVGWLEIPVQNLA